MTQGGVVEFSILVSIPWLPTTNLDAGGARNDVAAAVLALQSRPRLRRAATFKMCAAIVPAKIYGDPRTRGLDAVRKRARHPTAALVANPRSRRRALPPPFRHQYARHQKLVEDYLRYYRKPGDVQPAEAEAASHRTDLDVLRDNWRCARAGCRRCRPRR